MSFLQWFKKSELNYIMFGMNCRTLMKSLSLQLILQSLSQTVFTVLKSNCFQARSHLLRDKCIAGDRESFIQRSGNRKRTYTANSFCCMWIIHLNYLSYPWFQSLLSREVPKMLWILFSNAGGNNSYNVPVFLVGSGTEGWIIWKAEIGN